MSKVKILSIDGGGVRGIIPSRILQAIEESAGKPIHKLFDIIVGTSTGALITLCLANSFETYKASDIVNIYKDHSKFIFNRSLYHIIKTGDGLWGPKYPRKYLDKLIKSLFYCKPTGTSAMLSNSSCNVIIPTYSLSRGIPVVHSSYEAKRSSIYDNKMWEIAASATAAPTYFEPSYVSQFMRFSDLEVDGGIWTNNPEILAISEAVKIKRDISIDDISILSLGTGIYRKRMIKNNIFNSGSIGWLKSGLIDMIINADMYEDSIIANSIFPNSYRAQIFLPGDYQLDDSCDETLSKLLQVAEGIIKDEKKFKNIMDIVNRT